MSLLKSFVGVLTAMVMCATSVAAQVADRKMVTLDGARKILAAAEAEARKNNWNVAIAIVDETGHLIAFQKFDDVQVGSIDIAIGKARTAARMKRPTKALEDAVAGGRSVLLAVEGLMPLEGGVPITVDGRVIGAVGVSGVTSQQDAQIAMAGIAALTKSATDRGRWRRRRRQGAGSGRADGGSTCRVGNARSVGHAKRTRPAQRALRHTGLAWKHTAATRPFGPHSTDAGRCGQRADQSLGHPRAGAGRDGHGGDHRTQ